MAPRGIGDPAGPRGHHRDPGLARDPSSYGGRLDGRDISVRDRRRHGVGKLCKSPAESPTGLAVSLDPVPVWRKLQLGDPCLSSRQDDCRHRRRRVRRVRDHPEQRDHDAGVAAGWRDPRRSLVLDAHNPADCGDLARLFDLAGQRPHSGYRRFGLCHLHRAAGPYPLPRKSGPASGVGGPGPGTGPRRGLPTGGGDRAGTLADVVPPEPAAAGLPGRFIAIQAPSGSAVLQRNRG